MDPALLGIGSPSNYRSLLDKWISIKESLISSYWISSIGSNNSMAYWISNKIGASADISYSNFYSSQCLQYICDPLASISSWPWVILIGTPSSLVNYYLHNNLLDSSTIDVLGNCVVVPRRYKGIQSIGLVYSQLPYTYSPSSILYLRDRILGIVLLDPYGFYLSLALIGFSRRTLSLSIRMTLARDLSEQEHMRYSSYDTESGWSSIDTQ